MAKIMKIEREIVMKAARECYEGENLENYLEQISKKKMETFSKRVNEKFLANLERDHPGKNFLVQKASRTKGNIRKKIEKVLKGKFYL